MGQWFSGEQNLATLAYETGYPVVELDGWQSRGHGPLGDHVGGVVLHHTAGPEPSQSSSNFPSLEVVRDGRPGLAGPLAHYGIGYDGTIYVIAAGLAYHAGSGSWNGLSSNAEVIGIEAEDSGNGNWTPEQRDVYPRLVARICQFLGVNETGVCGHKEWTPRKIDPAGINMSEFRAQVRGFLQSPNTIDEVEDLKADERQALLDILQQLTGSRSPGKFPGWASYVDDKQKFTMVDYVRYIDKHVYSLLGEDLASTLRPIVEQAVKNAMGDVSEEKVSAVVDEISSRLRPEENKEQ